MLVKRKVAVKAVVTEEFKQQLILKLGQALEKVRLAQQQLDFQGTRYLSEMEGQDPAQAAAFRRRLERQKRKQEEIEARLTEELKKAGQLELGDEHLQGTLDGLTEVQVGDRLDEKLQAAEIVVRDGLVVEIRHD